MHAPAQEVGVWGWRAKAWKTLLERDFEVEAALLPEGETPDTVPVDAFEPYRLVIITEARPRPLTGEQHEAVHHYLRNGGVLLINTLAIGGMAGDPEKTMDLSRAEKWLGARRYFYGRLSGQVLDPGHPALAHLGDPAWFADEPEPGLTQLTTARSLVGTPERARVLVHRVGKGGVIYLAADLARKSQSPEERESEATRSLHTMVANFLRAALASPPDPEALFGPKMTLEASLRRKVADTAHAKVGTGELPIVLVAADQSHEAAETLSRYLEASLGKKPLSREPQTETPLLQIHIGRTPYVETLGLDFASLHPFGYYLKLVDANHLVLAGNNRHADLYAVYDLLKRRIGYRFFAPGRLGEVIPKQAVLSLPEKLDLREEPDIPSYTNAGLHKGNFGFTRSWRTTLNATHVLGKIISPARYARDHPEYFPMYDGKRFIPDEKQHGTWQPCVSNPDLPGLVIEWARDYFAQNPQALGFPLGVNDGGGDCRCPECTRLKETFHNQYIPFYNATAKLAKKAFPGKYVAFIAYAGAASPPKGITLEDNLLVEVTNIKKGRLGDIEAWRKAGARQFGLYDYLYGSGQVVPRHYPHLMADHWNEYARQHGLKSLWVESYILSWYFDGARQYVLNEVAWDLNASVDALLADYFQNFYGPAAVPMQRLFEHLEAVYSRKENPLFPFADWKNRRQLENYTEADLEKIRRLIGEARSLAGENPHGQRLELFDKLWSLSEKYVRAHLLVRQVEKLKAGEDGWDRPVAAAYATFQEIKDYHLSPEEEEAIFSRGDLRSFKSVERIGLRPELEIAVDRFLHLTDRQLGEGSDAFLKSELARVRSAEVRFLIESHLQEKQQIAEGPQNLFFQKGENAGSIPEDWEKISDVFPGWYTWKFPRSVTRFDVSTEGTPDGRPAMLIGQNDYKGCYLRHRAVRPGERYRIRLAVRQAKGDEPGSLLVRWKDADGRWLAQPPVDQECPPPNGDWQEVSVVFSVPEEARSMAILLNAPAQPSGHTIAFHQPALYKVGDALKSRHLSQGRP